MLTDIVIIFLLIVLNGVLAMSELALVSVRKARLKVMADQGSAVAAKTLKLSENPGAFLSTVQIGITLVGILAGAYSGGALAEPFSAWLVANYGLETDTAEFVSFGVVVGVITYFSLIVGELVPKQIALGQPERIAMLVVYPMTLLSRIAAPFVWLLDISSRFILAILSRGGDKESGVSEEEIKALISDAENAGVIDPHEKLMISGIFRLGDRNVKDVMTPRREIDMIDISAAPETIKAAILATPHSHLPAHDGNPDQMTGVIHAKELLNACMSGAGLDNIRALVHAVPVIPDTMDALSLMETLKANPVHMAFIHDEYGHFHGIVTATDILEAITGVYHEWEGEDDEKPVLREDGTWLLSGSMPADEAFELMSWPLSEKGDYSTVAGMILIMMKRLPKSGDRITHRGWTFEVMDMDGRRIDKILATPPVPEREDDEG